MPDSLRLPLLLASTTYLAQLARHGRPARPESRERKMRSSCCKRVTGAEADSKRGTSEDFAQTNQWSKVMGKTEATGDSDGFYVASLMVDLPDSIQLRPQRLQHKSSHQPFISDLHEVRSYTSHSTTLITTQTMQVRCDDIHQYHPVGLLTSITVLLIPSLGTLPSDSLGEESSPHE